jgi:hypothetical protein
MATSFIVGRSQSIRREPPTMGKHSTVVLVLLLSDLTICAILPIYFKKQELSTLRDDLCSPRFFGGFVLLVFLASVLCVLFCCLFVCRRSVSCVSNVADVSGFIHSYIVKSDRSKTSTTVLLTCVLKL